jgi:chaperonin GroEL (HSP60 family)
VGYTPDQVVNTIAAPAATGLEITPLSSANMSEAGVLDVAAVVTGALTVAAATAKQFLTRGPDQDTRA